MKRALVSYLKYPTRLPADYAIQFSNPGIVIAIVRVLHDMGYEVDVIDYTDVAFHTDARYDLFICPRGVNWEYLSRNVVGGAAKVFFACTLYWKEHNRAELKRFADLELRRGTRLPADRLLSSDEFALHDADGIICLGNEDAVRTFSGFPVCLPINNGAYPDPSVNLRAKDFESGKKHFLFYGSAGSIHKGLDLLLEAFLELDAELYWVGQMEPHLLDLYKSEIESHPNIHLVGWVTLRSSSFYEIMRRCNCVILPSCAEGQVGGVVECMNQGLIPIVSRASVLDVKDFGLVLEECSIREIRDTVKMIVEQSASWHRERAVRALAEARTAHSPETFDRTLRSHLESIVAGIPRHREGKRTEAQAAGENPSAYLESHHEDLGSLLRASSWLVDQARLADARPLLQRVLELEPECVTAICLLADVERQQGNNGVSEELLRQAVAFSPDDRSLHQSPEPAVTNDVRLSAGDSDLALAHSCMMNRAYEEARAELSRLINTGVRDVACLSLLGEARYLNGEHESGIEAMRKAAELPGGELALRNLGWMLLQHGEYAEALSVYTQLLVATPYDNEILVNMTYILQKLNLLGSGN